LPADVPFSNIDSIGQRAILKDFLASDFEHGIGAVQADDFCLWVLLRNPHCDIGEATPKI
jgi:hypothetical protein